MEKWKYYVSIKKDPYAFITNAPPIAFISIMEAVNGVDPNLISPWEVVCVASTRGFEITMEVC